VETHNIKPTQANLSKVLKVLNTSNKSKPRTFQNNQDLPMGKDVLDQIVRFGTVLTYPEGEIDFKDYPLSPIKKLAVSICSTETMDLAILHTLHSQIRNFE
jgi:hypothetical protein